MMVLPFLKEIDTFLSYFYSKLMHEELPQNNISDLIMTACGHTLNTEMRVCKL